MLDGGDYVAVASFPGSPLVPTKNKCCCRCHHTDRRCHHTDCRSTVTLSSDSPDSRLLAHMVYVLTVAVVVNE